MEAFAGLCRFLCQFFKTNGGVDEIAQDDPGHFGFAVKKQSSSLIQQCLGELGITLGTLGNGVFVTSGERHDVISGAVQSFFGIETRLSVLSLV
ncbi:hypothetical protein D9M73_270620 [compost metagenome]